MGTSRPACRTDRNEKIIKLVPIQHTVGPYAAAEIKAVRLNLCNSLRNIICIQAAGKEQRHISGFSYPSTDIPIVRATCTAEFFHCKQGIA
jgi:hypothetical protein